VKSSVSIKLLTLPPYGGIEMCALLLLLLLLSRLCVKVMAAILHNHCRLPHRGLQTLMRMSAQMRGADYRSGRMGRQLMKSQCGYSATSRPTSTCASMFDVHSQSTILWLATGCQVHAHMPPCSHSYTE